MYSRRKEKEDKGSAFASGTEAIVRFNASIVFGCILEGKEKEDKGSAFASGTEAIVRFNASIVSRL